MAIPAVFYMGEVVTAVFWPGKTVNILEAIFSAFTPHVFVSKQL